MEVLIRKTLSARDFGMLLLFVEGFKTSPQNGMTGPDGYRFQNNCGQPTLTTLRRAGMIQSFEAGEKFVKFRWEASEAGRVAWHGLPETMKAKAEQWADIIKNEVPWRSVQREVRRKWTA